MCSRCMSSVCFVRSLRLNKPSLVDQKSDEKRIKLALKDLKDVRLSLNFLRKLPYSLRKSDFSVSIILAKREKFFEVLDVLEENSKVIGIGVDVGSTTIALYFVDLIEKKTLKSVSFLNPQIEFGEDILTRLHKADAEDNLKKLHSITIQKINEKVLEILGEESKSVYYWAICGNTTMTHFLLKLPTRWLYREPYIPAVGWIDTFKARELGLVGNDEATVFVFPCAGSYFGGDLVSGIFYTELHEKEGLSLFVDVGTNAEVVLGNREFLLACAGAAGPALEGGVLRCGMQAAPGAIERVEIRDGRVSIKTIGNLAPKGICGSGAIDLLSEMFFAGLLSPQGKFLKDKMKERFFEVDGEEAFLVVEAERTFFKKPIFITQGEVKNLIRSKAAMYTILTVLCESLGVSFQDIEKFYVAGSFGAHIDVEKAISIGMLPDIPRERFVSVGNAAGKGVVKFLLNPDFDSLNSILNKLTYLEMNVENRFMQLLTASLFLPHTNLDLFPSVKEKVNKIVPRV